MNPSRAGDGFENWTTQVRKGLLELSIVNLLARGELYGYDLVKTLAGVRGLVVTEGTIYPLLSRLRRGGFLKTRLEESPSGPARKYYALTQDGHRERLRMNGYWHELNSGISRILSEKESDHG
ncbi:MAG: PadR family transcriptional regulator [Candidatus Hydrogenedentes bacterium]|nr:PadR family transcriptional regulator [Candidatus Hydrogenedentota bacterium]